MIVIHYEHSVFLSYSHRCKVEPGYYSKFTDGLRFYNEVDEQRKTGGIGIKCIDKAREKEPV